MDTGNRSFSVVDIRKDGKKGKKVTLASDNGGRYISKSPVGAAKKAFGVQARSMKSKPRKLTMIVTIQETTTGSSGKLFSYKVVRSKLKVPRVITKGGGIFGGGTPITISYETDAVATSVPAGI